MALEITHLLSGVQITGLAFSSVDSNYIYIQGVDYEVIASVFFFKFMIMMFFFSWLLLLHGNFIFRRFLLIITLLDSWSLNYLERPTNFLSYFVMNMDNFQTAGYRVLIGFLLILQPHKWGIMFPNYNIIEWINISRGFFSVAVCTSI
jgi:hypothetical protein